MAVTARMSFPISFPSRVAKLENGAIEETEIAPEDAGLSRHPFEAIIGGTAKENALAMKRLFEGEKTAYRDAVLLNAAAALVVAEKVGDLRQGVEMASESINSGAAKAKIAALARLTNEAANG